MSNDYASTFLNSAIAKGDPQAFLGVLFLFLSRFFPIVAQVPFFGSRLLPRPVKVCFGLSMFLVFLPHLLTVMKEPVGFNLTLMTLMAKEFFIGLLLGYMLSLPFLVVQSAGIFIDHQRGGASLMVNDPTIQNQSSPLGTLFNYLLIVLFFAIDGLPKVLEILLNSYTIIPPDKMFAPAFFASNSAFWDMQISLFNKFMVLSIQMATPALLIILMTDVFLGIANRLAPQVQITFLGMPLKSLLGLMIIWFGFYLFRGEMIKQTIMWINTVSNMITFFVPLA
jgi:type III secretion protein SpaR/YscT/HrcT